MALRDLKKRVQEFVGSVYALGAMYTKSDQRPTTFTSNNPNIKSLDNTHIHNVSKGKYASNVTRLSSTTRTPDYAEQDARWKSGLYRRLEDMNAYGSREEGVFADMRAKIDAAAKGNPAPYEIAEKLVHENEPVTVVRKRDAKNQSGQKIGTWYDFATELFGPVRVGAYPTEIGGYKGYPFLVFDKNATQRDKDGFNGEHSSGTVERKDISGQ